MKKVISAIIACVFVFAMATTAFAEISPIAPTINETTTVTPTTTTTTVPATTTAPATTQKPVETTTQKPDVDEVTTVETTTQKPVESDTNPSSPDTGAHVGKTVSAAAFVALALGGAVIYTSKKKAD